MKKITPFLWFDDQADEAIHFYITIFDHTKNNRPVRHGQVGNDFHVREPEAEGRVTFELAGQECVALPSGPAFTFAPAISFAVNCATQEDADALWEKLSAGGKEKCEAIRQAIEQIRAAKSERLSVPEGDAAGPDRRSPSKGE